MEEGHRVPSSSTSHKWAGTCPPSTIHCGKKTSQWWECAALVNPMWTSTYLNIITGQEHPCMLRGQRNWVGKAGSFMGPQEQLMQFCDSPIEFYICPCTDDCGPLEVHGNTPDVNGVSSLYNMLQSNRFEMESRFTV